jgi:hypothetical protein
MLMAKKKSTAKKKPNNPLVWFKGLSKSYKLLLLAGVLIITYVGYNLVLDYQDARKFDRIEAAVSELTERINQEFGTETIEARDYCRRDGEKYGEGQLSCFSSSALSLHDKQQGEIFMFILKQKDLVAVVPNAETTFSLSGFGSSTVCRFNENDNISPPLNTIQPPDSVGELYCVNAARSAYYPIND